MPAAAWIIICQSLTGSLNGSTGGADTGQPCINSLFAMWCFKSISQQFLAGTGIRMDRIVLYGDAWCPLGPVDSQAHTHTVWDVLTKATNKQNVPTFKSLQANLPWEGLLSIHGWKYSSIPSPTAKPYCNPSIAHDRTNSPSTCAQCKCMDTQTTV